MKNTSVSSHLLVLLQFVGIILSLFPINNSYDHHKFFLFLSLVGFLLGVVTLRYNRIGNFKIYPEIKQGCQLIINGPYHYIRHPMYTSLILTLAGITFCLNHPVNYAGLVGVMIAVFMKAKKEERLFVIQFPEYGKYIRQTTGFIPFVL